MARKREVVTVPAGESNRDRGKNFLITEMPAADAEKWALRLFMAVKGTAGDIPDAVAQLGMVGVAIRGINAFLAAPVRFDELEPLLDEMFTCVQIIRDPKRPDIATALTPDDIEEVQTRIWLRSEVIRVHTGFSFAEGLSQLIAMLGTAASANSSIT